MGLLNVRLTEEDAHLVRKLKEQGVSISDVVRAAIRERAAAGVVPDDTDAVLREMRERFPLSSSPSRVDATDRRAVQRYIRRKLRRARA
jgi:hypothetical protein